MSDFLVSLGKQHTGEDLLTLIKKPYGKRAPEGQFFDYDWGSIAVLEERLTRNENIITKKVTTFAWVGDLTMDLSDSFLEAFIRRIAGLHECLEDDSICLLTDELFGRLNGTFAIVLANTAGFSILTDPLSFVPVYVGKNKQGDNASFGTHPDLVAITSDVLASVDHISAAEFLCTGRPTFPDTMYTNVKQLNPGSLYCVYLGKNGNTLVQDFRYWSPPQELAEGFDVRELAEELAQSVISAVSERCCGGKVAVTLSGGLDSRLIMAAVPQEIECIGLTFGNTLNREMKTARRVCEVYNRQWFPLFRDKYFLERSLVEMVKLAGCEREWIHAHAVGFVEKIQETGADILFDGNGIDEFLKGYYAHDMVPVKRLGGILPTKYVKTRFDYENIINTFFKSHIKEDVIESRRARRKKFYNSNLDPNRTSMAEFLATYPHSQDEFCVTQRRVLPIRTCGADRRILEVGYKCPVTLKLGNQILFMACRKIYAKGCCIPSANDGVRPCSSHLSRLAQRGIRKLQDRTINVLEKFGKKPRIQHSWHDYQEYWDDSVLFKRMIQDYGAYLDEFDEKLFKGRGQDLLKRKDMDCRNGYRLLQIAIWRDAVNIYRL